MYFIKKHIVFFTLIVLGVISFGFFAYLYLSGREELKGVQAGNASKQSRISALLGRPGLAASPENTAAMQQYSEALDQQYNKLVGEMLRKDLTTTLFANPPSSNERFAIDHLGFREELRRLATGRERPDFPILLASGVGDFGFSEYSGVPPRPELVKDLYEQRKIIDFLVKELFKTGPSKLVSVSRGPVKGEVTPRPSSEGALRRERGMAVGTETSSRSSRAAILPKDVFEIPEQISARVPGVVDTIPIQIVFEGRTPSLRKFLNQIVASKLPIVVRNVEARSIVGQSRAGSATRTSTSRRTGREMATTTKEDAASSEAIVIPEGFNEVIADNRSEFTVTLEFLLPSREQAPVQGE